MAFDLTKLETIIANRAGASPAESYTARLIDQGVARCAQKLGEEGVEVAIAAVRGDRGELVRESADLLYHLLVTLKALDVGLEEVYGELDARQSRLGAAERGATKEEQA
ncbi:MAG: phosphoribosyl-ATP diphosphatase [Alphaproteobacteria bacterium]|nr:phosphoribosyl-ATP diphosphatase [Alphaproteobacteria bacterium]